MCMTLSVQLVASYFNLGIKSGSSQMVAKRGQVSNHTSSSGFNGHRGRTLSNGQAERTGDDGLGSACLPAGYRGYDHDGESTTRL